MRNNSEGQRKLAQFDIPFVEVGKATLVQVGGPTNNLQNVRMNDVTFFAHSNGLDPHIWTTHDTGGEFINGGPYLTGPAVPLSGNNLNAYFTINRWDNGKWGANVSGGGTYDGTGIMNGTKIEMQGGAAGAYTGSTSGTFQGTGAGTAREVLPTLPGPPESP